MKRRTKSKPPAKVAIWMPRGAAMANPCEVIDHYVKIVITADRHKVGLHLPAGRSSQMDYSRTEACLRAIKNGFSHIIMLDADHRHGPPDLVERLLAHDKDVVGSLNFARGDGRPCAIPLDGDPVHGTVRRNGENGLVQCLAIGTGALMIRLDAIKDWPQPWFYMPYPACENIGADQWPGEDGGFSINCQKHGVEIWCDTDLNSPHATTKWI